MPSPPARAATDENELQGRPVALTFVNAHLAAFDEMFDKRNADFHDLSKRLVFEPAISVDEVPSSNGSWYTPASTPLSIYDSDALFWLVSCIFGVQCPAWLSASRSRLLVDRRWFRVVSAQQADRLGLLTSGALRARRPPQTSTTGSCSRTPMCGPCLQMSSCGTRISRPCEGLIRSKRHYVSVRGDALTRLPVHPTARVRYEDEEGVRRLC